MTSKTTTVRVDKGLADEARRVLGLRSRTEAVHAAVQWAIALERSKEPAARLPEGQKTFS
jgi:Arc/MetJ family transcription regulator